MSETERDAGVARVDRLTSLVLAVAEIGGQALRVHASAVEWTVVKLRADRGLVEVLIVGRQHAPA